MAKPDIRPVPDPDGEAGSTAESVGRSTEPHSERRWPLIALAVALGIALILLVWSRTQMGGEIDSLRDSITRVEEQNALLTDMVVQRDALIDAQTRRLGEVRDGVLGLIGLIDQPIDPADPAP